MTSELPPASAPGQHGTLFRRVTTPLRSRWAILALTILLAAIIAGPAIRQVDPDALDLGNAAAMPSVAHPFGTDESGRDVLARLLYGGRVSLSVGLAAVYCSLLIGVSLGALAGYRRGLALGGSRPLPELFAGAGCRFDFSRDTLKPLLELVRGELATLN